MMFLRATACFGTQQYSRYCVNYLNLDQWRILAFGSADVMILVAGRVREGHKSAPLLGESFPKQGLKQGLLVHSEHIIVNTGFLLCVLY